MSLVFVSVIAYAIYLATCFIYKFFVLGQLRSWRNCVQYLETFVTHLVLKIGAHWPQITYQEEPSG